MTNYFKLPTWADKQHVYAVVETPRGSRAKLEFDPKLRAFTLAKPLLVGLTYPYDWGFIPSTKAEDGDPLDVLIIHGPGRSEPHREVEGGRSAVRADTEEVSVG
jgi:inorganic pyrophosphatase